MVTVPALTGVTTPLETVAMVASPLDQVTNLFEASVGATVAVRVPVAPPTVSERVVGATETALTATVTTVGVPDAVTPEALLLAVS
jgi:hypothetical protein